MENIVIIGAGLVGSLLSIYLAKAGFQVSIYERHSDPRLLKSKEGLNPSVNITLCERGFQALKEVGIDRVVRQQTIPLYSRAIHTLDEGTIFQPYGNNREALYTIRRETLIDLLLDCTETQENITIHFNQKCLDVNLETPKLTLESSTTGKIKTVECDRIFAADGAYSTVRTAMQKQKRFDYSQEYSPQGYKEIILPTGENGEWQLPKNALHIWPRDNFLLLAFPNLDGTFTLSLHMPFEGAVSHREIDSPAKLAALFTANFPDLWSSIEHNCDRYFRDPPQTMVTVKCFPWTYKDKVALIGDACHAIFPYHGQGINAGFEDCRILMQCLSEYRGDWQKTFRQYELIRKSDMDVIADLCRRHLDTLSSKLNDSQFLLRQEIERLLTKFCPDYFSLYHNITFTSMSYSKAVSLERKYRIPIERLTKTIQVRASESEIERMLSHRLEEFKV